MADDAAQLLYRVMFNGSTATYPPAAGRKDLNTQAGDATGYLLDFQAASGVVGRAVWQSPVFWLRPDLGTGPGAQKQNAVPIWRTPVYGGTTSLFVQIFGVSSLTRELLVTSVENGAINIPTLTAGRLPSICQPQDLTADFYDGGDSTIFTFAPPAANGPIQFWQVVLTFDQVDGVLGDVELHTQWTAH